VAVAGTQLEARALAVEVWGFSGKVLTALPELLGIGQEAAVLVGRMQAEIWGRTAPVGCLAVVLDQDQRILVKTSTTTEAAAQSALFGPEQLGNSHPLMLAHHKEQTCLQKLKTVS
jgi:hypothetical protein